ncbi:MAG: preprotein translocase subunit SecA [Verrucomicrobiota bacterium]
MISLVFKSLAGRHYRKFRKKGLSVAEKINALDEEFKALSDDALKGKTEEFKQRVRDGETLDELLPEAFATVKNAARRMCGQTIDVCGHELTWEMVHFDVQLLGGMALHQGYICEMATGEGKTLTATLPLYLNALSGKNCQLATVNDYLARRDSEWMGHLYRFLGISVGCLQNRMDPAARKEAYGSDITYGTASEFGFDYLRDNGMASRMEDQVQRDHYFCIIDEADSILIDEARTPLIISGPSQDDRQMPFNELKPGIQRLSRSQQRLCNELVSEAKKKLDEGDDSDDVVSKLFLVKEGAPKNKQFLRLMETPAIRKRFEKFDLEMNNDMNKTRRFHLKEELFFIIDEKQHQADLTEKGRNLLHPDNPEAFVLPDLPLIFMEIEKDQSLSADEKRAKKEGEQKKFEKASEEMHCISQLLRAYCLYEKDTEYVVQEGKVMIVDENTGRLMPGRRWSDGLHQAVEAKEGVKIEKETKTYASVTLQNYFRLYAKLSGMTGTAETEASEFHEIYRADVMVIPTHLPCQRIDINDVVYKTRRAKYNAVIKEIETAYKKGQPVLVGTASVESSEVLSRMLKRSSITHSVLNAKFHEQEAEIVSRAGQPGAVTIATNMAGRGTDIKLGDGVKEKGGLYVIGTERHESRRIDRQLRGRSARQGDPGMSKFFVSLEDDLMRLFANQGPLSRILEKSLGDEEELSHSTLNWSIENAQKKIEQRNYSIRKRRLQFDDVLNKQREIIYELRNGAIQSDTPSDIAFEMIEEEILERLDTAVAPGVKGETNTGEAETFVNWVNYHFPIGLKEAELQFDDSDKLASDLITRIREAFQQRAGLENEDELKRLARYVVIRSIDRLWQDHLTEMEELNKSVGLRSYGQKDPLNEYKSEAFVYFQEMMENLRNEICTGMFRTATNMQAFQQMLSRLQKNAKVQGPSDSDESTLSQAARAAAQGGRPPQSRQAPALPKVTIRREIPKIGRNEIVKIRKAGEEREMKFKKAEPLLQNEGWELVTAKEKAGS